MKNRTLPILVVNNTNKFIKIYRHGLIAKITVIQNNVTRINSVIKNNNFNEKLDLKDLFASKDSELGHTESVKMHIDVGKNDHIKMRPYRAPMKNREVIDKAIDEMLDADVIRRSRSTWSFPIVIVDKMVAKDFV